MIPFIPLKIIHDKLSNSTDKLNFQKSIGIRLSNRKGPDSLICPVCSLELFAKLAADQMHFSWFHPHKGGAGWESFDTSKLYRVDLQHLDTILINHCVLLARSTKYSNFANLRKHILENHKVIII